MNYCRSCVLPDTRPNLVIGDDGVCNACRNHRSRKDIDWRAREHDFRAVVADAKARSTGYDCLIPVSGGKDSTWQVVTCLERGLSPLCVTWKTPVRTAIGQRNLDNLVSLGVDHIDYQINPKVERKFILRSLEKYGTPAIPMHMAIFSAPLRLAVALDIPLMVWGENSAFEYGSADEARTGFAIDSEWIRRFGVTHGTTAADWVCDELSEKELTPYFAPPPSASAKVLGIFLGYYFSWDPGTTYRTAREHGFAAHAEGPRTGLYEYADIDDDFISVHHWMKWYKFGFTRLWDNLSLEIRNNRITRAEAIRIIAERGDETPREDIDKLCAYLGITGERFFEIAESFRDREIWKKRNGRWIIDGFLAPDWKWT